MAPLAVIPEEIKEPFTQLPQGTLMIKLGQVSHGNQSIQKGQSYMYGFVVPFTILEPAPVAGLEHEETFYIGTSDDPDANLPKTWTDRAGRLEAICNKLGFSMKGASPDMIASELTDQTMVILVQHSLEPATKQNRQTKVYEVNPYAGKTRANIRGWFGINEGKIVGLDSNAPVAAPTSGAPGMTPSTTPGPALAARPAPAMPQSFPPPNGGAGQQSYPMAPPPAAPLAPAMPTMAPQQFQQPVQQMAPPPPAAAQGGKPRRIAR